MINPIAVPGTNVPSGSAVSPGGAQGMQGLQGPSGPNVVSADAGNQSKLGSDSLIYTPGGINGFITKTAAYTLTLADRNKYIICSGGTWTLTLPAAAIGLCFNARNDQGITGTTGTITLQPAAGTIDGQASIALLPQQECLLISDGTNWRTFGLKREVILGTVDQVTSTPLVTILLPSGYRIFQIDVTDLLPVTNGSYVVGQFSSNGGSTWLTTGYYGGIVFNSSATAVSYTDYENVANMTLAPPQYNLAYGTQMRLIVNPGGTGSRVPTAIVESGARNNLSYQVRYSSFFFYGVSTPVLINAIGVAASSGNISNAIITVKGIV
jgi:hypothetical protein